jgi:hypothetical protein
MSPGGPRTHWKSAALSRRTPKADPRLGVVLYDGVEQIDVFGTIGVVPMAARVLPAIEAVTIAHVAGRSPSLAGPWLPRSPIPRRAQGRTDPTL